MAVRLVCVLAAVLCCALAAAASSAPVGGRAQVLEKQDGTSAGEDAGPPNVTCESLKKMLTDTEGNVRTARSLLTSAENDYREAVRQIDEVGDDKKERVNEACSNASDAIEKAQPQVQSVQQNLNVDKKLFEECEEKQFYDTLKATRRETWRYRLQSFVTASKEAKHLAEAASTAAAAARKAVEVALKSNGADDVVSGGPTAGNGAALPETPPPSASGGTEPSTQPPEVDGGGKAPEGAAEVTVGQTSGAHDAQGTAASTPVSSSGKATSGTSERAGGSVTGGDKHTSEAGGVTGTTAAPMRPPPNSLSALFHDVDGGVVTGGVRELLLVAAALALAVV